MTPFSQQRSAGKLFLIVGPSGVGKDSLIEIARKELPHFRFVRRYITRAQNSVGENHVAVTAEEFKRMVADNEFCVWWNAHDLSYGIHKNVVDWVESGRNAVVNGSRAAIRDFENIFPNTTVINITASSDVLKSRLLKRGRESALQIDARLSRPQPPLLAKRIVHIDNSGDIADAANRLIQALMPTEIVFTAD